METLQLGPAERKSLSLIGLICGNTGKTDLILINSYFGRVESKPVKGPVILSSFRVEGIFIIRKTDNKDNTPLITVKSRECICNLKFPGIIVGIPLTMEIGISVVTKTGFPDTKCWQIRKHSLRYLTVNINPLCIHKDSIRTANFIKEGLSNLKDQINRRTYGYHSFKLRAANAPLLKRSA